MIALQGDGEKSKRKMERGAVKDDAVHDDDNRYTGYQVTTVLGHSSVTTDESPLAGNSLDQQSAGQGLKKTGICMLAEECPVASNRRTL